VALGAGPVGRRPPEFFRWKHLENPFGPSLMLVAEDDGRVIGLRAFLRWRFQAGGGTLQAVRAVDTATHPGYQGLGVFTRLTRAALAALEGQVDLCSTPPTAPAVLATSSSAGRTWAGCRSRSGSADRSGSPGGCRPLPTAWGCGPTVAAEPAARVLERGEEVGRLLAEGHVDPQRLTTPPRRCLPALGAMGRRPCSTTPPWSRRKPGSCEGWPSSGSGREAHSGNPPSPRYWFPLATGAPLGGCCAGSPTPPPSTT
jgi:hypothetical protein